MSFWSSCLDHAPLFVPSLSQQGFLIAVSSLSNLSTSSSFEKRQENAEREREREREPSQIPNAQVIGEDILVRKLG